MGAKPRAHAASGLQIRHANCHYSAGYSMDGTGELISESNEVLLRPAKMPRLRCWLDVAEINRTSADLHLLITVDDQEVLLYIAF